MKSKIRILAVFLVMFCASFVPENNHKFFGDYKCQGSKGQWDEKGYWSVKGCQYRAVSHHSTWHWGVRHWIWLFAGITFSVWTISEVIIDSQKKYKQTH